MFEEYQRLYESSSLRINLSGFDWFDPEAVLLTTTLDPLTEVPTPSPDPGPSRPGP